MGDGQAAAQAGWMADHGPRVAWLMLAAVSAAVGGLASSRSAADSPYDCVRIAALLSGSATSSMGSWSDRRCCCAGPTTERGRRRGVRTWRRRGEGLRAIRLNSSKRREEGKGEYGVCAKRGRCKEVWVHNSRRRSGGRAANASRCTRLSNSRSATVFDASAKAANPWHSAASHATRHVSAERLSSSALATAD